MDLNNRYVVVSILESVEAVGWMKGGALAVLCRQRGGWRATEEVAAALRQLRDQGLIVRSNGRLFLTEGGHRVLGPTPPEWNHVRRQRAVLDPQSWAWEYYLMFRVIIPDTRHPDTA